MKRYERTIMAVTGLLLGIIIGMTVAAGAAVADPNDSIKRSTQKIAGELEEISDTLKKMERKMK